MTTEIVMCVYNGKKYIKKQLESIFMQTRIVDKLTIYDDCSTDNTVEIVRSFIAENNILTWDLILNPSNKGWRRGFYDAIVNSSKEIVFFADQDDYWRSDKIDVMTKILEEDSNIMVLNAGFKTIDSEGNYLLKDKLQKVANFDNITFKENLLDNLCSYGWKNRIGCAMAITARMRDIVANTPFGDWFAHDMFSVNVSSLFNACYMVNFYAIDYRLHDNNCSDAIKVKRIDNLGLNHLIKLQEVANANLATMAVEQVELLNNYQQFIAKRHRVLSRFAPFTWMGLLFKTKYYSNGKKGWVADFMDMMHLRKLLAKLKIIRDKE